MSTLVRITGNILSVSARSGTSTRTGAAYSIETANVLVADTNVTACQLPRRDETGRLEQLGTREVSKGESVDWLAEVTVYGQNPQVRVLGYFPSTEADAVNYQTGELASV